MIANEEMIKELVAEVNANTEISPELMAKIQAAEAVTAQGRIEEVYGPDADVITVLSGSRRKIPLVPIVREELILLGHQKVFEGQANKVHKTTTIYYRPEARENSEVVKTSIPELAGALMVEDEAVAVQYNSPVVVVLGDDFNTPNIYVIYGRMVEPALDFDDFGAAVKSFR